MIVPLLGQQAHDGEHRLALTGAGLADDSQHFTFFHVQADIAYGPHDPVLGRKLGSQVLYYPTLPLQSLPLLLLLRVKGVAQTVADEVQRQHRQTDGERRPDDLHRLLSS